LQNPDVAKPGRCKPGRCKPGTRTLQTVANPGRCKSRTLQIPDVAKPGRCKTRMLQNPDVAKPGRCKSRVCKTRMLQTVANPGRCKPGRCKAIGILATAFAVIQNTLALLRCKLASANDGTSVQLKLHLMLPPHVNFTDGDTWETSL